jgi:hypothetical protein
METETVSETLCSSEYPTMEKSRKNSNPECCTPLPEPFRQQFNIPPGRAVAQAVGP